MSFKFPPVFFFFLAYLCGIIIADNFQVPVYLLLLFPLLTLFFIYLVFNKQYLLDLLLIFAFYLLAVFIILFVKSNPYPQIFFNQQNETKSFIAGKIVSQENENTYLAEIYNLNNHKVQGKLLLILKEETQSSSILFHNFKAEGKYFSPPTTKNPYEFSYKDYLLRKKIYGYFIPQYLNIGKEKIPFFENLTYKIKENIFTNFKQTIPEPYNLLLIGIVFGKSAVGITDEIQQKFIDAGLMHILVASGAQVMLLLGLCLFFARFLKIKYLFFSFPLIILMLYLYLIIAGSGISMLRAFFMGLIYLYAIFKGKNYSTLSALSFVALSFLIVSPYLYKDTGFQLSFLATLGIILYTPLFSKVTENITLKNYPHLFFYLKTLTFATISAQIFVLPIIVYLFNKVAFVGFISNFFVLPLIALLLPLGILASLTGFISFPLTALINSFNYLLLKIVYVLVSFFAGLHFANIVSASPLIIFIFFFYVFLILLPFIYNNHPQKLKTYFLSVVAFSGCYFLFIFLQPFFTKPFLIFFDVGQGDSSLFCENKYKCFLTDAGGILNAKKESLIPGERVVNNFLTKSGIKTLEGIFATHPDTDHYYGLLNILQKKKVKNLFLADLPFATKEKNYLELIELAKQKNIPIYYLKKGDEINISQNAKIFVLNPAPEFNNNDDNNNSLVTLLNINNFKILLTADIEQAAEDYLIKNNILNEVDILKIAHHGSKFSSSANFLQIISPKIAIISSGKNNYGHPSKEVIKRLKDLNIKYFRTDNDGAITIKFYKDKFEANTFIQTKK